MVQIPEQQTMVSFKYELMISILFLKGRESFLEEHRNWKKIEEEKTRDKHKHSVTNTVVNLGQGSFVDQ